MASESQEPPRFGEGDLLASDFKIELAELAPPPPKPSLVSASPEAAAPAIPLPLVPMVLPDELVEADEQRLLELEDPHPTLWRRTTRLVRSGYFNPFQAFKTHADGRRLTHGQFWLLGASVLTPFLVLLITSFIGAGIYHLGAMVSGATPLNLFLEAAFYPLVFIVARGYWLAYLVLPILLLGLGWGWAALTAWNLSRDSEVAFRPLFYILAMVSAMLAPLTLFPMLRLLGFGLILMFTARRLKAYYHFPYGHQAARGGLFLVVLAVAYAVLERKIETGYTANAELASTMQAYYQGRTKLRWPSFQARLASPQSILLDQLGSLDPGVRAEATKRALNVMGNGAVRPDIRFQFALKMAEYGQKDAMVYAARAFRDGRGVPANPALALDWMIKAAQAQPANLELALDEAALYFPNRRALEGKRRLVSIAKRHMDLLHRVVTAVEATGTGLPDKNLVWEVQNLYRADVAEAESYRGSDYGSDSTRLRPSLSIRERLLARLNGPEGGDDQWFFRALVSEQGTSLVAGAQIYGETAAETPFEELKPGIEANDPDVLDRAGDHASRTGDLAQARAFWRRATLALVGDSRRSNAAIYLKLAKSYAPLPKPGPEAKEAIMGYLGYLALSESDSSQEAIRRTLKTLGVSVPENMDVSSHAFLSLCTRYDLPEGWAIMGSIHQAGLFAGMAKNPGKARECFLKAKELGYRGPLVDRL